MIREHFEVAESALTLLARKEHIPYGKEAIFHARSCIETAIKKDPYFATSFDPLIMESDCRVIDRMCSAAIKADVGPMAAVAGTVAWEAVDAMVAQGASLAVADNGGDIALVCDRALTIGIHTGGPLAGIGFSIPPQDAVLGICSSSAEVGPSISLGRSRICTVISEDVSLADACATALGNMVQNDEEEHLKECLDRILSIDGIKGAMINAGGRLAMRGDLPRLVKVKEQDDLITRRLL